MLQRRIAVTVGIVVVAVLILAACGGGSGQTGGTQGEKTGAQVAEVAGEADLAPQAGPSPAGAEQQPGDEHAADEQGGDTGHHAGDGHSDVDHGHGEGDHDEAHEHGVPAEAAAMQNPFPATRESIAAGAALYTQFCAVCHGPEGRGDGPGAAALDPKPANLHADHVQKLTDGGLFWIISNGVEGTGMPAWQSALSEEQRWQLVNYLRTFQEQ